MSVDTTAFKYLTLIAGKLLRIADYPTQNALAEIVYRIFNCRAVRSESNRKVPAHRSLPEALDKLAASLKPAGLCDRLRQLALKSKFVDALRDLLNEYNADEDAVRTLMLSHVAWTCPKKPTVRRAALCVCL